MNRISVRPHWDWKPTIICHFRFLDSCRSMPYEVAFVPIDIDLGMVETPFQAHFMPEDFDVDKVKRHEYNRFKKLCSSPMSKEAVYEMFMKYRSHLGLNLTRYGRYRGIRVVGWNRLNMYAGLKYLFGEDVDEIFPYTYEVESMLAHRNELAFSLHRSTTPYPKGTLNDGMKKELGEGHSTGANTNTALYTAIQIAKVYKKINYRPV